MAHEIEANFVDDFENEAGQCQNCTSFRIEGDICFCTESQTIIPPNGHCDFFQSLD